MMPKLPKNAGDGQRTLIVTAYALTSSQGMKHDTGEQSSRSHARPSGFVELRDLRLVNEHSAGG
jgi:hypothetical protein